MSLPWDMNDGSPVDRSWDSPISKVASPITKSIRLLKADGPTDQQIVTGIVYEPGVVDSQGDYATAETIEAACYDFALNGGKPGVQHDPNSVGDGRIAILESYICPADCEIGGQAVTKGTWIQTLKILDTALWAAIKSGEVTGLSLGGAAVRS